MTYTALYLILTAHSILGLAAIALCVRLSRQLRMTREKVDHLQSHLAFMNSSICRSIGEKSYSPSPTHVSPNSEYGTPIMQLIDPVRTLNSLTPAS